VKPWLVGQQPSARGGVLQVTTGHDIRRASTQPDGAITRVPNEENPMSERPQAVNP